MEHRTVGTTDGSWDELDSAMAELERFAMDENLEASALSESAIRLVDELLGVAVEKPMLVCRRLECSTCLFGRFCAEEEKGSAR